MIEHVVERALRDTLAALADRRSATPPRLVEALGYAVFPGGGRVRPRLCLEVARAVSAGGHASEVALAAACSLELLHCASLVHDDLPCFDAAATRRGKPSVHKQYGEAMAVLVGDGLMVESFATLARAMAQRPDLGALPLLTLLDAAGPRAGLVAGQAWEIEPRASVEDYHRAKTASLFEAAAALGAAASGVPPTPFFAFGRAFGMAYQLADDVADAHADPAMLGKPTGRDAALARPTAASGLGVEDARAALDRAAAAAVDAVPPCAGAADLRRFVGAVFEALALRCGGAERGKAARLSA